MSREILKSSGAMTNSPPVNTISDNVDILDIQKQEVVGLIDWVSFSFTFYQKFPLPDSDYNSLKQDTIYINELKSILKYTFKDEITIDYLVGGYKEVWILGEYIRIFLGGRKQANGLLLNMLEIKGRGCRDFESRGGSYVELFKFFANSLHRGNPTRIDGTLDCFTNKYFTMDKFKEYTDRFSYVSKARSHNWQIKYDTSGMCKGKTLYFGSLDSDMSICIYDKKLEKYYVASEVEEFENHYRIEMRFKHDRAIFFMKQFLKFYDGDFYLKYLHGVNPHKVNCNDDMNLRLEYNSYSEFLSDVLYSLLDFKDLNDNDPNKSRRKTASWWSDFLNKSGKAKFTYDTRRGATLKTKMDWCETSVFSSLSKLYIAMTMCTDEYSRWFNEQVGIAIKKYTNLDFEMIRDFLLKDFGFVTDKQEIIKHIKSLGFNFIEKNEE